MMIEENVSLLKFNTFGIEVSAKYLAEYENIEELLEILNSDLFKSNKFLHIGSGSNLLFTSNYDGLVLHSINQNISLVSENATEVIVEAAAGVKWDNLVAWCVENNWSGIENLTDIPGETGAAAVQNIGAYGVEVKDVIQRVKAVDTENKKVCEFSVAECEYGYRSSVFKHKYPGRFIITSVVMKLAKNHNYKLDYYDLSDKVKNLGEVNLQNIRKAVSGIRKSKLPDPTEQGNAGSFFMNPVVNNSRFQNLINQYPQMPHYHLTNDEVKIPAAWLIEQCGWKGKTLGKAAVHPKHALVIINTGKANASDIVQLATEIIRTVDHKFGITLQPEVMYV